MFRVGMWFWCAYTDLEYPYTSTHCLAVPTHADPSGHHERGMLAGCVLQASLCEILQRPPLTSGEVQVLVSSHVCHYDDASRNMNTACQGMSAGPPAARSRVWCCKLQCVAVWFDIRRRFAAFTRQQPRRTSEYDACADCRVTSAVAYPLRLGAWFLYHDGQLPWFPGVL